MAYEELDRIDQKQKELVDRALKKLDYEDLADEVEALKEAKQQILLGKAMDNGRQIKRDEMISFLKEQQAEVTEYDEQLVRRMVEDKNGSKALLSRSTEFETCRGMWNAFVF